MDEIGLFKRLGLALAIGLMIGVERGQHTRNQSGGVRVAGVRSFSLIGLLGGTALRRRSREGLALQGGKTSDRSERIGRA